LGRRRRTRSARERPPRMCTIPPRQQLSSTRRLAIRARGVTRARIRIRIRRITSCNNTHTERALSHIFFSSQNVPSSSPQKKTKKKGLLFSRKKYGEKKRSSSLRERHTVFLTLYSLERTRLRLSFLLYKCLYVSLYSLDV